MKLYYVKHDDWYSSGVDFHAWKKNRGDCTAFMTLKAASWAARYIRSMPRQFAGLGSRAHVVSVKVAPSGGSAR